MTWKWLKQLKYPGRDITHLINPILGFGGQIVNLIEMIHLPMLFGGKVKSRNLEVDFLVVNVPTTYNVTIGRLTLHKVKAMIAHHSLQL